MKHVRAIPFVLLAAGVLAAGPAAAGDDVFFREPDRETAKRIDELITQFASDAVPSRRRARTEMESFGWWAVDPLVSAARSSETGPSVKCASILTLSALGDRRAIAPLRDVVVREDGNPYVGAFAALALGRFRDGAATEPLGRALANPKNLEMLRVAAPFALAKLRTPQALDLLRAECADYGATERVAAARVLALGFFPDEALAASADRPGPVVEAALGSRRRGERQAAVLAFLVATARSSTGKEFLASLAETDQPPQVEALALLGLAAFPGADVTARIARAMTGGGPDALREFACDLLVERGDAAALAPLQQALRAPGSSARLRASAVLAIGAIEAAEAREVVVARLSDRVALVRAAAAVAAARSGSQALRDDAAARIAARLQAGESDARAREVLTLALQVLSGERRDVTWPEAGPEVLFGSLGQSPRQRLLRAVNARAQASLDLGKITDLQTEDSVTPYSPGGAPPEIDPRGGTPLAGAPGQPAPAVPGQPPVTTPSLGPMGSQRTSDWPELRDLLSELEGRPYFGDDDLPAPRAPRTGGPGPK